MSPSSKLVSTGEAARAIEVHPSTLWRWKEAGLVKPEWVTPGGQARWDIDHLRTQLGIVHDAA